ncbi:MAG: glycosyltransferase family 2 protein [Candidatus Rokuibacteriota bacterium]
MTAEPLVTVLTPVHNGEAYLAECIESVLAQTYRRWEYVIVDNGSTDATGDIARRYAEREPRLRVVRNPRLVGVIANHNIAFRQLSPGSAYCKVVHADDWLFPECLARMVDVARRHPSVGIVSAYRLEGAWVDLDGLPFPSTVIPGAEICRSSLLGGPYVFGSPTSILIRSDLVRRRDPFYDETTVHADEAACYEALGESDFGFVHQVLTYTRSHEGTVTASFARRLNTLATGNLMILSRYGPRFLGPAEYERRRQERLGECYRALARATITGKGREFWDHHRAALIALGSPLSARRLVLATCREALNALAAPGKVARRLGSRPRARTGAGHSGQPADEVRSRRLTREAEQRSAAEVAPGRPL